MKNIVPGFRYDKPTSWKELNAIFHSKTPNVLALIDFILTLPGSSTEAERGFSLMKVIKTDWRSCLSDIALSHLMMVKLEALPLLPSRDDNGNVQPAFDPLPAIQHFLSAKDRRKVKESAGASILPVVQEVPADIPDEEEAGGPAPAVVAAAMPPAPLPVPVSLTDPDMVVDEDDECYYSDDDLNEPLEDLRREEMAAYAQLNSFVVVSGIDEFDDVDGDEDFSD